MTTREKFVAEFGEEEAARISDAAFNHRSKEDGNVFRMLAEAFAGEQRVMPPDQFLLDISTCISWECLSVYHDQHGFQADVEKVRQWIKDNAVPPEDYRDPCSPHKYAEYLA